MTLAIQHLEDQCRFLFEKDGMTAYLDYELNPPVMAITHTWVPEALGGQGIAAELTQAALEAAQRAQWRIDPICSYTRHYLKKHPQYQHLLI